jgi:hypothetical protein
MNSDPAHLNPASVGTEGNPAFPVHALPAPLRRFVEEGAKGIPCPPDFLALPAIVILASAVGATREIELRPGWRERPSFLAAIIADPGTRKSPALALASRPLA